MVPPWQGSGAIERFGPGIERHGVVFMGDHPVATRLPQTKCQANAHVERAASPEIVTNSCSVTNEPAVILFSAALVLGRALIDLLLAVPLVSSQREALAWLIERKCRCG